MIFLEQMTKSRYH